MPLTPWRAMWETRFPSFRDEMDRLFEEFFEKSGFPSMRDDVWVPAIDIHETASEIVVTMDIPSIDPKEINITIADERLTVKGERKREDALRGEECYRAERYCGVFHRTVQLPAQVIGSKAKATYKDGVLRITIPKSQKTAPKEVKITIE